MTIIVDPSDLDRFQVAIDPVGEIISLRGLGTERHALDQTGDTDGTDVFTDAGANFTTDGVQVGDIVTIISDPAEDGGIIGHYGVLAVAPGADNTKLQVDRTITASTAADLTYKVNGPQTTGAGTAQLADGVTLQALYSFLKLEWHTKSAVGNAEDLVQFDFPFNPVTREQMIMGGINGDAASAWTFAGVNGTQTTDTEGVPRELIRTGGWQERDVSDNILRRYANVTTLGTLDSDAQVYFQQGDANGTPTNFKLTGAVNQVVLVSGPDVGPDTGTGFAFASTTITRNDGGNWATDNYRVGDYVIIRSAEDSANDSSTGWGPITAVDDSVDGAITIASASFTVNAADTTAIFQVDHRRYMELRARKKTKSYAQSGLNEIGVSVLEALVNKFPLAHADDPAITLQDGVMAGDGTATGEIFQETETHTTGSDGATESTPTADPDAFTFTSSGSTFNSTARSSVQILQPGDAVVISSGSDQGSYVIKSVDSAIQLTLWKESTLTYTGGEGTLNFTVKTSTLDVGAANATLADIDGDTGNLTSAASTFSVDTALGDRVVTTGDIVEVTADTGAVIGVYKIVSRTSDTILVLDTSDQIFGGQTNQTYRIRRPGMNLQRFETTGSSDSADHAFNDAGPDTITRGSGSFVTNGFVDGCEVIVSNADIAANDGNRILATAAALTLTFIAEETLSTDASDTNANVDFDYGVIRTINQVNYPFHWRLFANGGTLDQIFQFLQWKLRLTTDINLSSVTSRGDITDLLMTYASPNGVTLDLYPDDLDAGESNNVTYQDQTGDSRNNAFLVGITFQVNNNLINSAQARLTAFFTSVPSGDFGSNNAIIVDDNTATDMDFTTIAGNIQRSFDYTNNNQGGRTPDTDAAITVVALGDDLAQHILVTTTITKVSAITVAVGPALERNYSNP